MSDNNDQIDYWNGEAGNTWVKAQSRLDTMFEPLTHLALTKARVTENERVIDVGCGCGDTSILIARQGAQVWGIDISEPMLEQAKLRAKDLEAVIFSQTDAASQEFTDNHDLIFSRFGVMFFSDPVSAFANLHSGLSESGRLMFMCWEKPSNNDWISVGAAALKPFMPQTETAPDPRAPGPFAFADKNYTESILNKAGFHNIQIESASASLNLGKTLDEAVEGQTQVGVLARILKEVDESLHKPAIAAVRDALSNFQTDAGVIMNATVWLVSAEK